MTEKEVVAVVCEDAGRKVLIKMKDEKIVEEVISVGDGKRKFKHYDRSVSEVKLAVIGLGSRYVRVHGLPVDVEHDVVAKVLSRFGKVNNIVHEMWRGHKLKVMNGVRGVRIDLERHVPSYVNIGECRVWTQYAGQPKTCSVCDGPHLRVDCPRRKRREEERRADGSPSFAAIVQRREETTTAATPVQEKSFFRDSTSDETIEPEAEEKPSSEEGECNSEPANNNNNISRESASMDVEDTPAPSDSTVKPTRCLVDAATLADDYVFQPTEGAETRTCEETQKVNEIDELLKSLRKEGQTEVDELEQSEGENNPLTPTTERALDSEGWLEAKGNRKGGKKIGVQAVQAKIVNTRANRQQATANFRQQLTKLKAQIDNGAPTETLKRTATTLLRPETDKKQKSSSK